MSCVTSDIKQAILACADCCGTSTQFICAMTGIQAGNKSRPQRFGLAQTGRGLSRRAHFPRAPSQRKRLKVAGSQPAPYQWAPLSEGDTAHEALERKDFSKFVQFFRQASPYIEGHRGRTFVIVIPGEVRFFVAIRYSRCSLRHTQV